jgi:hypothetical protein
MLMPVMARSAGIETDTGLLSPPMVDNKPVNVKTGLFLTNLIDVDEVKETFRISGYFFMTWKDPRLVFSPAGGETDRSYKPDSIWIPHVFLVNAAAQREKTNVNIKGNPDGTIHYLELFKAELTTSFYLEPFPFELAPSWWTPGLSCQPLIVTSFEFCGTTITERRMAPPAVIE